MAGGKRLVKLLALVLALVLLVAVWGSGRIIGGLHLWVIRCFWTLPDTLYGGVGCVMVFFVFLGQFLVPAPLIANTRVGNLTSIPILSR